MKDMKGMKKIVNRYTPCSVPVYPGRVVPTLPQEARIPSLNRTQKGEER